MARNLFADGVPEPIETAEQQLEKIPDLRDLDNPLDFSILQGTMLGAGFVFASPEEKVSLIRSIAPEAQFGPGPNNTLTVTLNGQTAVLDKPGFGINDAVELVGTILAFAPASLFALSGKTLGGIALRSAGADAATSVAVDVGGAALGTNVTKEQVLGRAAFAGSVGAVLPFAGAGVRAVGQKIGRKVAGQAPAPKDALPGNARLLEEAEAAERATNIDLFPAQRTQVKSSLEEQAFVAELSGGAEKALLTLRNQNQQVGRAVDELLDEIAPAIAASRGPARARAASGKAVDAVTKRRTEKTSPLFKEVFSERTKVDIRSVVVAARDELVRLPKGGQVARKLREAIGFIEGFAKPKLKKGQKPPTGKAAINALRPVDLQRLHNAKIEIDELIETQAGKLGPTTVRQLTILKDELRDAMTAASPRYGEALEAFAKASPPVDELTKGIIGEISKVKDSRLKGIANRIFDAAETNPAVVGRIREILDSVDPGAFDDLLRVHIQNRIGKITATGLPVENIPGKMGRAIFGNTAQTNVVFRSLKPAQRANARFLQLALRRASTGRPGGSQTAGRAEISKDIRKRGVSGFFNKIFSFDITKPLKGAGDTFGDAAFERQTRLLADVIFDPSFTKDLTAIRKLAKTNENAAALRLKRLLKAAGLSAGVAGARESITSAPAIT